MAIKTENKEDLKEKLEKEFPLSGGETNEDLEKVLSTSDDEDDEEEKDDDFDMPFEGDDQDAGE